MVLGLDNRLFRNPSTWRTDFHEKDLLYLQTFVLQMLAMVPINFTRILPEDWHSLSPTLNRLTAILLLFFGGNVVACALFNMTEAKLEQLTYLITVSIIGIFSIFTLQYYQWSYTIYLRIVDFVNRNFVHRSAFGVTCVTGEPSYLLAKRFSFFWSTLCLMSTLQWIILAVLNGYRTLPVGVNYPFLDQRQTPYYHILFALQCGFQYVIALGFATGSNILFSVVVIICGQFDMLFCSLKNIRNTAMVINGNYLEQLM